MTLYQCMLFKDTFQTSPTAQIKQASSPFQKQGHFQTKIAYHHVQKYYLYARLMKQRGKKGSTVAANPKQSVRIRVRSQKTVEKHSRKGYFVYPVH